MKLLYPCLILFLCYFPAFGQITFDQIPKDLQLYPRDATNQADVIISGTIGNPGFTKIGVQVFREGQLTSMTSQTLASATPNVPFRLVRSIKAERAEYQFKVFIYIGKDSALVADRKRIVCGDVFILHGQSNALALAGLDQYYSFNYDDKYLRNCTYPYGSSNIPADMSWYAAKTPYGSVGGFGLTLQRLILEQYGIPTVLLNGAVGGTGIAALEARNPNNHADLTTIYGQLLYRAQWAGVDRKVKAIIWKQGEDEAGNKPDGYDQKFKTLYNQFHEDYGDARLYVGQINILADKVDGAAWLRDFQRRTKYLFPNVESIATVGATDYDGIHYGALGHQQLAGELFRQIARDLYGSKDTLQINSPDVKKVFYNARKDSITIAFDDGMQMVWRDTAYYDYSSGNKLGNRFLKDFFYLDRKAGLVAGGTATGNRVTLSLKQPSTAKFLRYLPAYFSDALSPFYNGPYLRNSRGMRAFSFDSVSIADVIAPVTTLAAKPLSEKQIQLNWTVSATAQTQILERSDGNQTSFKRIATLNGTTATYADDNLADPFGTYYYRLRAFSPVSESAYSNVVVARPLVLGIAEAESPIRIYPIPLATDRMLHIEAQNTTFSAITIRDVLGRVIKDWQGKARNELTMTLDEVSTGMYIADLQTTDGQTLRQKIVVR